MTSLFNLKISSFIYKILRSVLFLKLNNYFVRSYDLKVKIAFIGNAASSKKRENSS